MAEGSSDLRNSKNWQLREEWFAAGNLPDESDQEKDIVILEPLFRDENHEENKENEDKSSESCIENDAHNEEAKPPDVESRKKQTFCQWFSADLKRRDLGWVKAVFFFQSASLVVLYPYLTIHMRSLGFTVKDAALVNAAIPAADVFGPPAAGILADKIGNFRVFMSIMTLLNGAACLLLLAMPHLEYNLESNDLCCTRTLEDGLSCRFADSDEPIWNNATLLGNCTDLISETFVSQDSPARMIRSVNESLKFDTISDDSEGCYGGESLVRCSLEDFEDPLNWTEAFWTYMAVRVVLDLLRASSLMLFEGAVVVIIKDKGGDYGLQKLFGTAGAVIFGPLAGKIIDWNSVEGDSGGSDYANIFYLYFALRLIAAILVLKLQLNFKSPAKKVFKKAAKILLRFEVLTFLLAFGICGLLWGFLENYLFWYLEDMGSTKLLMGLSLAIGTLAGIPLTIFSRWLLEKLGPILIVSIGLLLYAIRCAGYSIMPSAEYAIILEALKPWCSTLTLIASFSFVKSASPVQTAATVEGVFGALYFGVGRGLGGLFGGLAVKGLGDEGAFRCFAAAALASAVIYCVLYWGNLWRKSRILKARYPENPSQQGEEEEA